MAEKTKTPDVDLTFQSLLAKDMRLAVLLRELFPLDRRPSEQIDDALDRLSRRLNDNTQSTQR